MAEDEISESWEDLEDSGELDKQIKKLAPKTSKQNKPNNGSVSCMQEDSERMAYQPQVRILKRQPKADSDASKITRTAPKPTKTLAEREAAYAEARLRILGSASQTGEDSNDLANDDRPARLTQQLEGVKVTENVIRQPKGPDGTKGFNERPNIYR